MSFIFSVLAIILLSPPSVFTNLVTPFFDSILRVFGNEFLSPVEYILFPSSSNATAYELSGLLGFACVSIFRPFSDPYNFKPLKAKSYSNDTASDTLPKYIFLEFPTVLLYKLWGSDDPISTSPMMALLKFPSLFCIYPSLLKYWGWSSPCILDIPYLLSAWLYLLALSPDNELCKIWEPSSSPLWEWLNANLNRSARESDTVQLLTDNTKVSEVLIGIDVSNLYLLGDIKYILASSIFWYSPLNSFHTETSSLGANIAPVEEINFVNLSFNTKSTFFWYVVLSYVFEEDTVTSYTLSETLTTEGLVILFSARRDGDGIQFGVNPAPYSEPGYVPL